MSQHLNSINTSCMLKTKHDFLWLRWIGVWRWAVPSLNRGTMGIELTGLKVCLLPFKLQNTTYINHTIKIPIANQNPLTRRRYNAKRNSFGHVSARAPRRTCRPGNGLAGWFVSFKEWNNLLTNYLRLQTRIVFLWTRTVIRMTRCFFNRCSPLEFHSSCIWFRILRRKYVLLLQTENFFEWRFITKGSEHYSRRKSAVFVGKQLLTCGYVNMYILTVYTLLGSVLEFVINSCNPSCNLIVQNISVSDK